ncbi:MAG: phage major capsid protein [Lutisporaceae bacterium]
MSSEKALTLLWQRRIYSADLLLLSIYLLQKVIIQAVSSTGTADWVEDGDPIPESADTFTQFLVKSYKLASLVKLNRSFVTDMNFNLEKYLMGDVCEAFWQGLRKMHCLMEMAQLSQQVSLRQTQM